MIYRRLRILENGDVIDEQLDDDDKVIETVNQSSFITANRVEGWIQYPYERTCEDDKEKIINTTQEAFDMVKETILEVNLDVIVKCTENIKRVWKLGL